MIEIEELVKHYGDFKALDHLNLKVDKGEILGLLGPNGSGKSTTINCILSLLSYDSGAIKLFGEDMNLQRYDLKKKIGVVPQDIAVFDELNVTDNIQYFCGLYVKKKEKREKLVEEAIQLVGLEEFRKFYPKQLSGGLKRRLNIACGIAHKPELIFLDEPTVAVDPQSRNKILDSIMKLNQKGATIVYTTHYMEEVEMLCNNIVIIDKGRVVAEGTKEQLKETARDHEKLVFKIQDLKSKDEEAIGKMLKVVKTTYDQTYLTVTTKSLKESLLPILNYFKNERITYFSIQTLELTLNDVFLKITGKELRD